MLDHTALCKASIDYILTLQQVSGAYPACPEYAPYQYCWLRDGSFIAHAMSTAGQWQSAQRFHEWVHGVITRHAERMDTLIARREAGESPAPTEHMHTRFTYAGDEVPGEAWGEFQLDGYGTWLWSLTAYLRTHDSEVWYQTVRPSVVRIVRYLATFWQEPCYDCWEEHGDEVHTATLGAILGGLEAMSAYDPTLGAECGVVVARIREMILSNCMAQGRFAKSASSQSIDASLVSLAVPYVVFDPHDEVVRATVACVESELGMVAVHRYPEDTYYGGGAWILLSAWLGWYHASVGNIDRARAIRDWIVQQQQEGGGLPEQVPEALLAPERYDEWVARQGAPATPLLWSHAMYIILEHALGVVER